MKDRYQQKSMGNRRNSGGGGFGGGGGGRNFGGGSRQNDGYREQPTLYRATCDQCGDSCEVPFRPSGSKPVLCRDCFRKDDGGSSSSRFGSKRPDRGNSFDKPSYKSTPRAGAGNEEVVKQLKTLNAKIQQMLDLLIDLAGGNEEEMDEEGAEYEEGVEEEIEEDEDEKDEEEDEVEEEEKDEKEDEEEDE